MIEKRYKFDLDFSNIGIKTTNIVFVQGDTGVYFLDITLKRNGEAMNLAGVGVISIKFVKPDGTEVVGTANIIDESNGLIEYKVGTQEITVQGKCFAEVQIFSTGSERLTSTPFLYNVRDELGNGEWINSTTEYPILTDILADLSVIKTSEDQRITNEKARQAQEKSRVQADLSRESRTDAKIQDIDTKANEIENRFNILTTAKQQDAEVINARTSTVKSKTYSTLNDRLEDSEMHEQSSMPHKIQDLDNNKTYRYGFQVSADGKPQIIYEEVL